jgi:predicted nuclease of predicted toxin-antitoxin system
VCLLIDANLSPKVAAALGKAGLESVHVGDVGLLTAPGWSILDYAAGNALVIVSADAVRLGRPRTVTASPQRSAPLCAP